MVDDDAGDTPVNFNNEVGSAGGETVNADKGDTAGFGFKGGELAFGATLFSGKRKAEADAAEVQTDGFSRTAVQSGKRVYP